MTSSDTGHSYLHRGAQGDRIMLKKLSEALGIDEVLEQYSAHDKHNLGDITKMVIAGVKSQLAKTESENELEELLEQYRGAVRVLQSPVARTKTSYKNEDNVSAGFSHHLGMYEDRLAGFLEKLADVCVNHDIDCSALVHTAFQAPLVEDRRKNLVPHGGEEILQRAKESLCKGLGIPVPEDKSVYDLWEAYSALSNISVYDFVNDGEGASSRGKVRLALIQGKLTQEINSPSSPKFNSLEQLGQTLKKWAGEYRLPYDSAIRELCRKFEIETPPEAKRSELVQKIRDYIGAEHMDAVLAVAKARFAQNTQLHGPSINPELLVVFSKESTSRTMIYKGAIDALEQAVAVVLDHPECQPLWQSMVEAQKHQFYEEITALRSASQEKVNARLMPKPEPLSVIKPGKRTYQVKLFDDDSWTLRCQISAAKIIVDLIAEGQGQQTVLNRGVKNTGRVAEVEAMLPDAARDAINEAMHAAQGDVAQAQRAASVALGRRCEYILNQPAEVQRS